MSKPTSTTQELRRRLGDLDSICDRCGSSYWNYRERCEDWLDATCEGQVRVAKIIAEKIREKEAAERKS